MTSLPRANLLVDSGVGSESGLTDLAPAQMRDARPRFMVDARRAMEGHSEVPFACDIQQRETFSSRAVPFDSQHVGPKSHALALISLDSGLED